MEIIITGATGLLGGWLISDLLESSHNLTIIRYKPRLKYQSSDENPRVNSQYQIKNFHKKCKEVYIDLFDYISVEKIVKETQADAIIHMADVSRVSIAKNNPKHTYELAANGTLNLLEAIRLHSLKTIFICHTEHKIYSGNHPPFNEEMLFNPEFIFDAAKISKEYLTKIYSKSYGVKGVTIRSGTYFGGYDFNFHKIIPYVIKCIIRNEKIELRSDGNITRDFLYIKDAVLLNRLLLNLTSEPNSSFEFGEAFNFSLENNISVIEVINKISTIFGIETEIDNTGGGHLLYGSSEIQDIRLDCSKAKVKLNWQPKYSLESGLKETIDFYKSFIN
tara:strand:- start:92 stop:1093 length:1002 start_codon:yes stop_codon:yes gene_type:complete